MDRLTRTLVFDDGSAGALAALQPARALSSEVVLVSVDGSANTDALGTELAAWDVPVRRIRLDARQGIRHALALCASEGAMLALVPDPGTHRGALVRKCVQAVASAPHFELPALAVHIVRDGPRPVGPVVHVRSTADDDGFADLVAVGMAVTLDAPLRHVTVGAPVPDDAVRRRAVANAREAAEAIAQGLVTSLPQVTVTDADSAALDDALAGAGLAVVGFGGFDVTGRKWSAPDEIPDSVLEDELGHLVHVLARRAPCDVVVVIDSVRLRHGAASGAALGLVAATVLGGTAMAGGGVASAAPPGGSQAAVQVVVEVAGASSQIDVHASPTSLSITNRSDGALTVTVRATVGTAYGGGQGQGGGHDATETQTVTVEAGATSDVHLQHLGGNQGHQLREVAVTSVTSVGDRIDPPVVTVVAVDPGTVIETSAQGPQVVTQPPPTITILQTQEQAPPDPQAHGQVTPIAEPYLVPQVPTGGDSTGPVAVSNPVTTEVVDQLVPPLVQTLPPETVVVEGPQPTGEVVATPHTPTTVTSQVPTEVSTPEATSIATVTDTPPVTEQTGDMSGDVGAELDGDAIVDTSTPAEQPATSPTAATEHGALPTTGSGTTVGLAALGAAFVAVGGALTLAARSGSEDEAVG